MEPIALKRLGIAAGIAAGVCLVAILIWRGVPFRSGTPSDERPNPVVPAGTRIRVEVINATRSRGLARRATFYLRDLGFDVVRFATDTAIRDSTLILDRTSPPHPSWTKLLVRALGTGRVDLRPDSTRYLDVTVLLGADWHPPAKPFYP